MERQTEAMSGCGWDKETVSNASEGNRKDELMRARRTKEIARKRRGPVEGKGSKKERKIRKRERGGKKIKRERNTRERALLRYINLSLFCFACVIRGWGWMRRKSGGRPPPTGEGVVLLQSTYRHPVQTTLVPHTNVCTYVRSSRLQKIHERYFQESENNIMKRQGREKEREREKQKIEIYKNI